MADIVKRLRTATSQTRVFLFDDAGDEIERLRAALAETTADLAAVYAELAEERLSLGQLRRAAASTKPADDAAAESRPMLYSAEALKAIEVIRGRLGNVLKRKALELTKRGGRNLVTEDDVRDALGQTGMTDITPDDDAARTGPPAPEDPP